jgi:hypothetical protein
MVAVGDGGQESPCCAAEGRLDYDYRRTLAAAAGGGLSLLVELSVDRRGRRGVSARVNQGQEACARRLRRGCRGRVV